MNEIVVGFSTPNKWKPFSWLIMKGYGIPYNHVYIKFWSETFQRYLIYQASHTMVNFMGQTFFEEHNKVVDEFKFTLTDENKTAMIQFAIDNAGKPYGALNCIGLAVVRICEIFGKKITNPFADGGRTYVCCELVNCILKEYAGLNVPFDSNNVNPKELYTYLSSLKE